MGLHEQRNCNTRGQSTPPSSPRQLAPWVYEVCSCALNEWSWQRRVRDGSFVFARWRRQCHTTAVALLAVSPLSSPAAAAVAVDDVIGRYVSDVVGLLLLRRCTVVDEALKSMAGWSDTDTVTLDAFESTTRGDRPWSAADLPSRGAVTGAGGDERAVVDLQVRWCVSQWRCWQNVPQYRARWQPLHVSYALRPQFQQFWTNINRTVSANEHELRYYFSRRDESLITYDWWSNLEFYCSIWSSR